MLGKRINRWQTFTMCRAFVLTGLIALAHVMGPLGKSAGIQVSEVGASPQIQGSERLDGFLLIRAASHGEGFVIFGAPFCDKLKKHVPFSGEV